MKKILITGGSGFIGTNLVEYFLQNGENELINVDIKKPKIKIHEKYWSQCDILDHEKLDQIFKHFLPETVIHLAAKADVDGKTLDDYKVNTEGTQNLIDAITNCNSVKRVIITSTQFVNQYNGIPKNDEDYAPHTIYGESKVLTEKFTRNSRMECTWTIIRPTNIWGPWHWRYPNEFWKVIAQGRYLHPKNQEVIRSYGYVGNVCWQINRILEIEEELVHQKVFYVGDYPINILEWVNEFSKQQTGKRVREVNLTLLKLIAFCGDLCKIANIKFPLTSSRLRSMTTSNGAPMNVTYEKLGTPPYNLEEGVKKTIIWLKEHYPNLVMIS